MNSLLYVTLSTGSAEAKLFFGVVQHAAEFEASGFIRRRRFRPSFMIYQETLYTHTGIRVSTSEVHGHDFSKGEILSPSEFDCLFWMILDENEAFEKAKDQIGNFQKETSNHMADALAYHVYGYQFSPCAGLEKRLIDNLNIPGLESALREAVKRENYEAAAYIRDRIQAQQHIIFDDHGELKVRLPQPSTRKRLQECYKYGGQCNHNCPGQCRESC